jgi:hypothetical protein
MNFIFHLEIMSFVTSEILIAYVAYNLKLVIKTSCKISFSFIIWTLDLFMKYCLIHEISTTKHTIFVKLVWYNSICFILQRSSNHFLYIHPLTLVSFERINSSIKHHSSKYFHALITFMS